MACILDQEPKANDIIIPMIDARRMEAYIAIYNGQKKMLKSPQAHIITATSFQKWYLDQDISTIYICGDGSAKAVNLLDKNKTKQVALYCDATYLITEAYRLYTLQKWSDIKLSEPFYLKSPNIIKSTKKLL